MKKLLVLLGATNLVAVSSATVVACGPGDGGNGNGGGETDPPPTTDVVLYDISEIYEMESKNTINLGQVKLEDEVTTERMGINFWLYSPLKEKHLNKVSKSDQLAINFAEFVRTDVEKIKYNNSMNNKEQELIIDVPDDKIIYQNSWPKITYKIKGVNNLKIKYIPVQDWQ